MSGRGRGRGVSNKPAWMSRQEREHGGPVMDNNGGPLPPPPDRRMPPGPPDGPGPGPPMRRGSRDRDHHRGYDPRHDEPWGQGGPPRDMRRGRRPPPRRGDSRDRRSGSLPNRNPNSGAIVFRSFEEEQQWVEERRRKRLSRKSKFDVMPTPEQAEADAALVALSNPAATDFAGINAADRNFSAVPQQTRHARRLYIGQLPPYVTEQELHDFFRNAIEQAVLPSSPGTVNGKLEEDPILSVYINHERRFCFLEFKTVEMTTACMALDGIDIHGKGQVKVKRPNDYNPTMAPKVPPQNLPQLDTSKLGIISGTVADGPNKIFVGGLHYHLAEDQVLELLQAFGKVKAFHLVKNDPDSTTSKGYCFVEYADPAVTQVATIGLNGMDLGGGKQLTARVAGERSGTVLPTGTALPATAATVTATPDANSGGIPPNANIVNGYDIEALVDAAMGQRPMPTAPMYLDSFGMPLTRLAPAPLVAPPTAATPAPPRQQQQQQQQEPSALDIANAALAAVYGRTNGQQTQQQQSSNGQSTRILVLSNMVTDEDLATDEDYEGLQEEVREECAKFGQLKGMHIPRKAGVNVEQSAVKKIFLEYASVQDAQAAERELSGRKFGDNTVQTSFLSESDYSAGRFK